MVKVSHGVLVQVTKCTSALLSPTNLALLTLLLYQCNAVLLTLSSMLSFYKGLLWTTAISFIKFQQNSFIWWISTKLICDALQQNREQMAQAYFEIWAIEVGIGVRNNSSIDSEIFVFLHALMFSITFKSSAFSAAFHIQTLKKRKL